MERLNIRPGVLTPYIPPEGKRVRCQICDRHILGSKGLVAHHGFQRPGRRGYQTRSCMGARYPSYEVCRDRLQDWIRLLYNEACDLEGRITRLRDAQGGKVDAGLIIVVIYHTKKVSPDGYGFTEVPHFLQVTRANFDDTCMINRRVFIKQKIDTYDKLLARELTWVRNELAGVKQSLDYAVQRFHSWKPIKG